MTNLEVILKALDEINCSIIFKSVGEGPLIINSSNLHPRKINNSPKDISKIQDQIDFCKKNNLLVFMSGPNCPYCDYALHKYYKDTMKTELITGCPNCHKSFCE